MSLGWEVMWLLPAAVALLVLVLSPGSSRLRRRGLLISVCGGVLVLGACLLFLQEHPTRSRVVFVLDHEGLLVENRAEFESLVSQYVESGMEACDVLLLGGAAPPEPGRCPVPADLDARSWLPPAQCAALALNKAVLTHKPDCALQVARRRLSQRWWLDGLLDTIQGHSRRIAVVASQPRKWARTWVINPKAHLEELTPSGISVDLIHRGPNTTEEQTPILTIDVTPHRFPERRVDGVIELRLESPALGDLLGRVLTGTTQCEIDLQDGSGYRVPPREGDYRVESTGAAVRIEPVRLADFKGEALGQTPYDLVRGFHLLECRVTLRFEDGRDLSASAARYLDVGPRYFLVVLGQAGAFAHDDQSVVRSQDVHALWGKDSNTQRALGDISFGDVVPEATFLAHGLGEHVAPAVLVLHDLSKEAWKARCADLQALVASGTTLLVSGAPPRSVGDACAFLPAFAKAPGTVTTELDRRPRVTFLLDASHLGRLQHRPQAGTQAFTAYLPEPTSQYTQSAPLADGFSLQREVVDRTCAALRQLDASVDCQSVQNEGLLRTSYVHARTPLKSEASEAAAADTEPELAAAAQLHARLRKLYTDPPGTGTVLLNDVLVLFTYDVEQLSKSSEELTRLLRRGVFIQVVELSTPYAAAVQGPAGSRSLAATFAEARGRARSAFAPENIERAAAVFSPDAIADRLRTGAGWKLDLASKDPRGDATRVGNALGEDLRKRLAPEALLFALHRRGRFVDERVGPFLPEGEKPRFPPSAAETFAAPLRLQALERNEDVAQALWFSAVPAPAQAGPGAPSALALAHGGIHGRGEILVLGYSVFEGLAGKFFPSAPWRDAPRSRIARPGATAGEDIWGPRRVMDAIRYQSSVEPGPGEKPRITAARVVDPSGRIEVEVVQRFQGGSAVDGLELVGCRAGGFFGPCVPPEGAKAMAGRIVDLDTSAQRYTYSFAPSDLDAVCGELKGCIATLRRRSGSQVSAGLFDDEVRLFVGGLSNAASGRVADLPVLDSLRMLALYSGGGEVLSDSKLARSLRPLRSQTVQALLTLFLCYWLIRLLQRTRTARALRLETRRQVSALVRSDARGAVNSAGDALGRPQSTMRVGTFAGFRPFEPGDRLSAAVREDVLLFARQRAQGGKARIPRVSRHIEEVGRHVRIVVNVGQSMRIPASQRGLEAKLLAAAKVCELVAEVSWRFRSNVEVVPTGLNTLGETFGPVSSPGARGTLAAHILEQGRRPARWTTLHAMPDHDQPVSVVVVSDFLNEDLSALRLYASNVEEEGGLFGAIHIHTPAEFLLLGAGVAPARGVLCDRTTWSESDMRLAHTRFRADVEGAIGGFAGGLLSVSAALPPSELLTLLSDSPLLDVLR